MRRDRLTTALAILAPIALTGAAIRVGTSLHRQAPNVARAAVLAQADPPRETLILGNSAAGRGVDGAPLGASVVWFPASRTAVWYAALRLGVLDHPSPPTRLMIVAPAWHLLDAYTSPEDAALLASFDAGALPELASALALPEDRGWRDGLRAAVFAGARRAQDAAIEQLFPSKRLDAQARIDHANEAMAGAGDVEGASARKARLDLGDSWIEEIIDAATDAGLAVDVVAFPTPATSPAPSVSASDLAALIDAVSARGARWIDLRGVALPAGAWIDNVHLTDAGRRRFTEALAAAQRGETPATAATPGNALRIVGVEAPELTLTAPPPRAVPFQPARPEADGAANVGRIEAKWAKKLTSAALLERFTLPHCSPLRLLDRGAPLPDRDAEPPTILGGQAGAWRHVSPGVIFATPDGTAPDAAPERYTITLDPERRCRHARWIYPDDVFTLRHPVPEGAAFDAVELGGALVVGADQPLHLTFSCDDAPCGELRLTEATIGDARLTLSPPPTRSFAVEARGGASAFYLITGLSLTGAPP
jgi:hypothetical protein